MEKIINHVISKLVAEKRRKNIVIYVLDYSRLNTRLGRIWKLMGDGKWRTCFEIQNCLDLPLHVDISVRLRDLRKPQYKRLLPVEQVFCRIRDSKVGNPSEYQVIVPEEYKPKKCVVFGCTNTTYDGKFVGDMCSPCYHMITTGEVGPTDSFLNRIK